MVMSARCAAGTVTNPVYGALQALARAFAAGAVAFASGKWWDSQP